MRIINLKLIGYLLRKNYIQIGIVFLVAAFAITRFVKSDDSFAQQWELWLEAAITFSIVGMTVLIWYNEQRQDWENSLPKKLNIKYKYNGKDFCTVLNAPLSSESDIRTWGTSIAGTILNKKVLIKFSGFFMKKPITDTIKGVRIYDLEIFIDEPINGISQDAKIVFLDNGELDKTSFIVPDENNSERKKKIIEALKEINNSRLMLDWLKDFSDEKQLADILNDKISRSKETVYNNLRENKPQNVEQSESNTPEK